MAPILIDSRGLIKIGLISLLTACLVFFAGFFSGYEQAATVYASTSEKQSLALPVKADIEASELEVRIPEKIVAGEDIDVDQPDVLSSADKANIEYQQRKTLSEVTEVIHAEDAEVSHITNVSTSQGVHEKKATIEKVRVAKDTTGSTEGVRHDTTLDNNRANDPLAHRLAVLPAEELNKIKYSVQVGMYGRLVNAENMVNMLKAKQLNAYVSDYTNSKHQTRYNVRFGYFKDKKSALFALKKYNADEQGDGYLVRFSVENITKLADARFAADTVKTQEQVDQTDQPAEKKSPAMVETRSPV